MPIIKDKQITENSWSFIADGEPIEAGDITVSLSRWNDERQTLQNHNGRIGIRLTPSDSLDQMTDFSAAELIELEFPVFTDGRLFSVSRLLKDRYDYKGEVRAVGKFLADQVFYLHRVGVNSFELNNPRDIEVALNAYNDFSVHYQSSNH